jgi:hypothetical protein
MKKKRFFPMSVLLLTGLLIGNAPFLYGQSGALAVQDSAMLEAQLDYIHENTRIYNDYRAIREDVFLKMKQNVKDTLSASRLEAERLQNQILEQDSQIDSLNADLSNTRNERDDAIKNRDSLSFLGIQMGKGLYNVIMWLMVLGLAFLTVILVLLYKRSHLVTKEVKEILGSTQEEFEQYRKTSREKYEKLVISHHNEIMKLKKG